MSQLHNIGNISKVTGASEGDIKEYVQTKKKNNSNEQKITKFIEALWRTIFYGWFTIVGVKTMLYPDVIPWVTDNRELYLGWPEAHIASAAVMYYYQIELGSYFHQLLWTEVSRSDSIEMIAHHIITILLLTVSHSCSFHRYGTMLLILHDVSDVFLESAKCFNYIAQVPSRKHFQSVCDGLFVGFVVSFFVCRLILYPKVFLINSFAYAIPEYFKPYFYFAVIILTLFSLLFFLHCFWFYLTIKMAIRILFPGEDGVSDVRSDNEDEVDDFAEDLNKSKDPPIARKKTKKDN